MDELLAKIVEEIKDENDDFKQFVLNLVKDVKEIQKEKTRD